MGNCFRKQPQGFVLATRAKPDTAQECAICLELYTEESVVAMVDKRHGFHAECLLSYLNLGEYIVPLCPICRVPMELVYTT
jgi:hypothetical protein